MSVRIVIVSIKKDVKPIIPCSIDDARPAKPIIVDSINDNLKSSLAKLLKL